jgi:uncharacterized CHY-type Zn-finger protein
VRNLFEHGQHLLRAAALLVGGALVFVALRGFLIPDGFGDLGHYRAGALEDNASRQVHFAGRQACAECHTDIVEARVGSKHERVGCEACHGALAAHAADPGSVTPELPDAHTLCLVCHRSKVTMPASFPQIDPAEHGEGSVCTECHSPHHPEIE